MRNIRIALGVDDIYELDDQNVRTIRIVFGSDQPDFSKKWLKI
jgi:hypothetical protein